MSSKRPTITLQPDEPVVPHIDGLANLLLGPPGTGKTTALLDEVERALAAGTPPERIVYVAFTRAAANTAKSRAKQRFSLDDDDLPWFRTLHSLAFAQLQLDANEIMQTSHWRELGEMLGLDIRGIYETDYDRPPSLGASGRGDALIQIYAYARATGLSPREAWRQCDPGNCDPADVERFVRALEKYKHQRRLYDFADLLDLAGDPISCDLMILDEAQDLTKQQWDFARRVGAYASKVVLAGDDDQAVYRWSGADVNALLKLHAKRIVLPKSHRLPSNIYGFASEQLAMIDERIPKIWSPREAAGEVAFEPHLIDADVSRGEWLLLARTRRQLPTLENLARAYGRAYWTHDGGSSTGTPAIRAALSYERARRGHKLGEEEARNVLKHVPGSAERPPVAGSEASWAFLGLPWHIERNAPDWMHALDMSASEREYLRSLRRNNEPLTDAPKVRVSTIHGAKGDEADNVLLLGRASKRTRARRRTDDESRVRYVGVTRARQRLVIGGGSNLFPA